MLGNMCMIVGHDAKPKNEKNFNFFKFLIFSILNLFFIQNGVLNEAKNVSRWNGLKMTGSG